MSTRLCLLWKSKIERGEQVVKAAGLKSHCLAKLKKTIGNMHIINSKQGAAGCLGAYSEGGLKGLPR